MRKIFLMILCIFFVSVCANCAFASDNVDNIETDDSIPISDNNDFFVSVDIGEDIDFNCTEIVDESNSISPSDNSLDPINATDFNSSEIVEEGNSISASNNSLNPINDTDFNVSGIFDVNMSDFESDINATSTQKALSVITNLKLDSNDPYYPYVFNILVKFFDVYGASTHDNMTQTLETVLYQIMILAHEPKAPQLPNLNPNGPNFKILMDERNNIRSPGLSDLNWKICHYANVFIEHPEWNIFKCVKYVSSKEPGSSGEYISSIVTYAHNLALANYGGSIQMTIDTDLSAYLVYILCYEGLLK